nr:ribonuclease H-like domain-containing protein [Tanacetum cinerariifolium]
GWDWSFMANEEEDHALVADEEAPTEFTLMAKTSTDSEVFDNSLCSKNCKKNTESLNGKITDLTDKLCDSKNMLLHYKAGLSQVEDKKETIRKPSVKYVELYRKPTKRKIPTGNTKFSTADLGNKGTAVKALAFWIKKPTQNLSNKGNSQNHIDDKGYWDSGCSQHMTGNISYHSDYEPFDGGYVSFGQGGCKITDEGTIKIVKLEFENVYFVKDLKYNLFSVS